MKHSLFLLLIIALCTIVSCSAIDNFINIKPSYIPTRDDLVKTVYIDKSFDANYQTAIETGLHAWECKTNGLVKFTIVKDVDLEQPSMVINPTTSLLVKHVVSTDTAIIEVDKDLLKKGLFALGVYFARDDYKTTPTIVLVSDRLFGEYVYTALTEHEVGHALGLEHSTSHNSIMFDTLGKGAATITDEDLDAFCHIYGCSPTEFTATCK